MAYPGTISVDDVSSLDAHVINYAMDGGVDIMQFLGLLAHADVTVFTCTDSDES